MEKNTKQILLGVFIIIFGLLSWFFLHQLFYSGINITFLIGSIVGLLFWGIVICVGILFVDKKFLYLAFILSLLSFFIFFHGAEVGPGQFRVAFYYFIIMVLIFLTFLIYRKRIQYEKKVRIKMHFWRILKRGLPLMFTAVCLLIALAYYFSPSSGEVFAKTEFQIPRSLFDTLLKPFSGLIQSRLPADVIGDENLNDVLYELVNSQIKSADISSNKYIPIVLAVGLFFSLRVLVIILVPIVVLFSCLLIKILISAGFVKITTKSVEAEKMEI